MDIFTTITIIVHVLAVVVLLSTLPRQIQDIWTESDARYRKVCWIIFLGTICLMAMNIVPFMQVLFYETPTERIFWNISNMVNGIIGVGLGVLAHRLFSITQDTVPKIIDDTIDKHKR